jgi:hypothetical protein
LIRRPFAVTVLAVAVLLLAAANLIRFAQTLEQAEFMHSLGLGGPLIALAATGAVWTVGFGAAAVGLYRLRRWAWRWMLAAIVVYQVNVWLIRLIYEKSAAEAESRPADAVLSLLSIILVWAVLLWPGVRRVFRVRRDA